MFILLQILHICLVCQFCREKWLNIHYHNSGKQHTTKTQPLQPLANTTVSSMLPYPWQLVLSAPIFSGGPCPEKTIQVPQRLHRSPSGEGEIPNHNVAATDTQRVFQRCDKKVPKAPKRMPHQGKSQLLLSTVCRRWLKCIIMTETKCISTKHT